jgi:hypothetical protein
MQRFPIEIIIIPAFLIFFAAFWSGLIYLISLMTGWQKLANEYRTYEPAPAEARSFRSARIGWSNYNGVLTMGVNSEGMYLAVFFLFRMGHAPLFIPWSAVEKIEEAKVAWMNVCHLYIKGIKMSFPRKYFDGLENFLK